MYILSYTHVQQITHSDPLTWYICSFCSSRAILTLLYLRMFCGLTVLLLALLPQTTGHPAVQDHHFPCLQIDMKTLVSLISFLRGKPTSAASGKKHLRLKQQASAGVTYIPSFSCCEVSTTKSSRAQQRSWSSSARRKRTREAATCYTAKVYG